MPPLPTIADVFRCAFVWECGSAGSAVNVMHFEAPGKTEADVWTAINTHMDHGLWDTVSGDAHVASVDITPLDGASGSVVHATDGTAKWVGNIGGAGVPNVAAIVKLESGLRGRDKRGRLFLPLTGEAVMTSGKIDGTTTTPCTASWVAFANACATDGVALGIASYKYSSWHQAVGIHVETAVATQRRRQDRIRAA